MRRNNFSSAADRRWQRRYERIQQRKEEERERRDRQGKDDPTDSFALSFPTLSQQEAQRILDSFNGLGNVHAVPPGTIEQYYLLREEQIERDRREQQTIYTSPTIAVTIPRFDEPNRNGTVISREVWENAMAEYCETTVDATQRSLAESVREAAATGEAPSSLWNRLYEYMKDDILEAFSRAAEHYRADTLDDWFDAFVDVKDVALGDRAIFGVDLAGVEIPEPDLDAGDNSALDSFLGKFLAPGA